MAKSDEAATSEKTSKKKGKKKARAKSEPAKSSKRARRTRLRHDGAPVVGVVVGAPLESRVAAQVRATLEELDVPAEVRVLSPHWTPHRLVEFARDARQAGFELLVTAGEQAVAVGAVLAAQSTLPVVAVPAAEHSGREAFGVPVRAPASVPLAIVGEPRDAALFAARVLAGAHPELSDRLEAWRQAALDRYDDAELRAQVQARGRKKTW